MYSADSDTQQMTGHKMVEPNRRQKYLVAGTGRDGAGKENGRERQAAVVPSKMVG